MSKDERAEKMDMEIAMVISTIEKDTGLQLTQTERDLVHTAFLYGNHYGLQEARMVIKDSK